jgi:hypothetical protein
LNSLVGALLLGSTLAFSWLAMQAIHELGHVAHAVVSGGVVTAVVLDPLSFSRTDVSPNPQPQFVAWGGPVWGCLAPLALWALLSRGPLKKGDSPRASPREWPTTVFARCLSPFVQNLTWLAAFFAGFCLIANGAYIAAGSLAQVGDARELIRTGAPRVLLLGFGGVTVVSGLAVWHRLGPACGFRARWQRREWPTALWMAVAAVCCALLGAAVSARFDS